MLSVETGLISAEEYISISHMITKTSDITTKKCAWCTAVKANIDAHGGKNILNSSFFVFQMFIQIFDEVLLSGLSEGR